MDLIRAGASLAFGLAGGLRGALHAHAAYTLALWCASLVVGREGGDAGPVRNPAPHIAVLVVAHDEASVVEACVASLRSQSYPADRFDVTVIADHCTDETATLAAAGGAAVIERRGEGARGKPAAVAFGVARLLERGSPDAIAIFDADNVADPGFLAAVAARLQAGEAVVQGLVDAKNADASWVAAASAIGFWAIDGVAQRPRERLGLSAALMGTGFVARPELFAAALAPTGALADDIEAGARLALRGVRVAYEPSARTLDEKPTARDAADGQRRRWMQGRWAAAERWLPALVTSALSPVESIPLGQRARLLDVAVQMVAPSLLFTSVALGTLSGAELVARVATGSGGGAAARRGLALSALYFLAPAAAVARHRPAPRVWVAYFMQPAFLLRSVPLAIQGFATRAERTWTHTRHGGSRE